MISDIHTHKPAPYPEGVVSMASLDATMFEGQLYSVGIHPWNTISDIEESSFDRLTELALNPQIVAIGECGIDLSKGGALFKQIQVFKRQIDLAEQVRKPLIIHCVKASDIILGLKRDLKPVQPWIIHGFRGKPSLAKQFTEKGCYLSFGQNFNPDSLLVTPNNLILAETDESILTITEIIGKMSEVADKDLTPDILNNSSCVLNLHDYPFIESTK